MTRAELLAQIVRCDAEIENCIRCQGEMWRAPNDRLGAAIGECDWLSEKFLLLEQLQELDRKEAA